MRYSVEPRDSGKKYTTDAIKTASKRAIQKTAEAMGDLIGNKTADKITSVSKEFHSKNFSKRAPIKSVGGGVSRGSYKNELVSQETIDLNISWSSIFFRKYFIAPAINFSFLFKA